MSSEQITTIVGSICTAVIALVTAWKSWRTHGAVEAFAEAASAHTDKLVLIHDDLNGKLAALIAARESAAHAAGKKEEREEQRSRQQ